MTSGRPLDALPTAAEPTTSPTARPAATGRDAFKSDRMMSSLRVDFRRGAASARSPAGSKSGLGRRAGLSSSSTRIPTFPPSPRSCNWRMAPAPTCDVDSSKRKRSARAPCATTAEQGGSRGDSCGIRAVQEGPRHQQEAQAAAGGRAVVPARRQRPKRPRVGGNRRTGPPPEDRGSSMARDSAAVVGRRHPNPRTAVPDSGS